MGIGTNRGKGSRSKSGKLILVGSVGNLKAYNKKNLFYKCKMREKTGWSVTSTVDSTTEIITRR